MNNDYRPPACLVSFYVTRNTFTINIGLNVARKKEKKKNWPRPLIEVQSSHVALRRQLQYTTKKGRQTAVPAQQSLLEPTQGGC